MQDRALVAAAWTAALVSVTCSVLAVPLAAAVGDAASGAGMPSDLVIGTVWPLVGAVVVQAQPRNPVGWLMLVTATMGPYQLLAVHAAATGGEGLLGGFAAWVAVWGFAPAFWFVAPLLPHFFPDGHLPGRRWRLVVGAVLVVAVATLLARMFSHVESDIAPDLVNPLGVSGASWLQYVTLGGSVALLFVGVPLAAVSLALRARRADSLERTQLQWLALGALVMAAGIGWSANGVGGDAGFAVGLVGLPLGIGVAIVRHGLFDVGLTLNRTVVLGLLTGLVVAVYAVAVYGVQAVAPGSRWGVLLVAAAALAAAAGRDGVQRLVDRWLFGNRHNAYAVVAGVTRQVQSASEPIGALQRLVDGLRESLRLPYVAFTAEGISLSSGRPVHGARVVAAEALGENVGQLHVGLRSTRERWSPQQQAAVEEVAARAGTLAYAAHLVADVAQSRGRIVTAREEERRRLRADLHDGVAPGLAGTALQLESLARRLEDPDLAARALTLRDGLRETVGHLRALVHGLRPPVLDQLGLEGALRQLVVGHDEPSCTAVVEPLGGIGAAVEVAAYAIASEALTNALRHSAASRVDLEARVEDGDLVVTVRDNGVGLPARIRQGVGTVSMAERARELGGRLDLLPTPGGGTTVRAELPLEVS